MADNESKRKGALFWFITTLVVVAGVALLGTIVWRNHAGAEGMSQQLEAWKPYLMIWRYSLIVAVIAAWKPAVEYFLSHWPGEDQERMIRARWRIAAWLIIIELVVVQGVVGKAISGLLAATGSGGAS